MKLIKNKAKKQNVTVAKPLLKTLTTKELKAVNGGGQLLPVVNFSSRALVN